MSYLIRIENILFRVTKIVIYLIPCLPLYISSSTVFPFITGKNFAFRILVELIAALWLCLIAINREYRPKQSIMSNTILIFVFIVGLADLFGMNAYKSFWSNYERMEGYITILHLALYFMVIKSIFRTEKNWNIFFNIILLVSVAVSLFTFIEPLSSIHSSDYVQEYGERVAGTIGAPPFLASYLLLSSFLGIFLLFTVKDRYLKLLYLISVLINSVTVFVTASRGAILSAVIGAVIIGIFFLVVKLRNSRERGFNKVVPLVIGVLIMSTVFFLAYRYIDSIENNRTIKRFTMISADPAVKTRLEAWKRSWNGIKKNPVLGWGQENYIGVYTVNPIPLMGNLVWVDRAHNIVVDWLVNAGILGLCSYLAIFGASFYILRNNYQRKIVTKNETLMISTTIIVYFIQNLFIFDTINTYLIFFALLAYIDNIGSIKNTAFTDSLNDGPLNTNKIKSLNIFLIVIIVFTLVVYYINYIPIKQLQSYSRIIKSLSKYESISRMLDDFNKALSYGRLGNYDIRDQMEGTSSEIIKYQLYKQEGALRFIQATADELEMGIAADPYNLQYLFRVYGFYNLLASYDASFIPRAEALIEKCLLINPDFKRMDMSRIDLYFLKKDYESAYISLEKLVERYPDKEGIQFKLALASIMTYREDAMKRALENVSNLRASQSFDISSGIKPVFYIKQLNLLAQTHKEVKDYKNALKYYNEILFNLSKYRNIRFAKGYIEPLKEQDKKNMRQKLHLEIEKIKALIDDKGNTE